MRGIPAIESKNIEIGEIKNEIKDGIWDRLENCILRLQELQNLLLEDERTKQCYTKAKEKIGSALELVNDFKNSPENREDAGAEKKINEALDDAEQYLNLGIFQELSSIIRITDRELKELNEAVDEALDKKDDESGDEWTHILHLSDLHFGIYIGTENEAQDKTDFFKVVETQFFSFLKNYIENTKIDIVAVTGDICFGCKENGYHDFQGWLERLCGEDLLNIDIKSHVVMCPGNHDKKCDTKRNTGWLNLKKCDDGEARELLTIDKIAELQEQFPFFNNVCRNLDMEPLRNFDILPPNHIVPYVMGIKEIDGIHFVVLNSAWNSFPRDEQNGSDHGQLLLGRRPMESMFDAAEIKKDELTVLLFHHPLGWLHEEETRSYTEDQAEPAAMLVRRYADVVLNGHVHGGIEPPDILADRTVVFGGGTLYTKERNSYLNQFEIISVNRTRHYCRQTVVGYNRREGGGRPSGWEVIGEKYPSRIHYGMYRDIRDLIAKYSLGEITREQAEQEAFARSGEVCLKAFEDLFEKIKFYPIKMKRSRDKAADTMDDSVGKAKTMAKDSEDGDKQP